MTTTMAADLARVPCRDVTCPTFQQQVGIAGLTHWHDGDKIGCVVRIPLHG
jgi:hypothetical protein